MTSDWKKSDSLALSFRAKREIFVIRGQTNHVRKAQMGNLISWKPWGIASYILRHIAAKPPPLFLILFSVIMGWRAIRANLAPIHLAPFAFSIAEQFPILYNDILR